MHILYPYMHGRYFSYMEIYTFVHSFALLTHFVCEGLGWLSAHFITDQNCVFMCKQEWRSLLKINV